MEICNMNIIKNFLLLLCISTGIACASQDQSPKLGVKHARSEEVGGAATESEQPAKKAKTAAAIADDSSTAQAIAQYNAALVVRMAKINAEETVFGSEGCGAETKSIAETVAGVVAACAMPATLDQSKTGSEKTKHTCSRHNKSFSKNNDLAIHTMIHTSKTPFKCFFCKESFAERRNLKAHYNSKEHKKERLSWKKGDNCGGAADGENGGRKRLSESEIMKIEENSLNPFACNQCEQRFGTESTLKNHMPFHDGKQKFKCESCELPFVSELVLNKHYKSKFHQRKVQALSLKNPGGDGGGAAAPMADDAMPMAAAAAATSITSGSELKRLAELPAAGASLSATHAIVPSVAASAAPVAMALMQANMPYDPMTDVEEAKDPAAFAMPFSFSDSAAIAPMAPFVLPASLDDLMLQDDGSLILSSAAASSDLSALANDLLNGDL